VPRTPRPDLPPRGISRSDAAAYIGISPSLFDRLVGNGKLPQPLRLASRKVWDVRALDRMFDALSGSDFDAPDNEWDTLT
jgi:predicted DNA-binding transcriptional regulator AlpA